MELPGIISGLVGLVLFWLIFEVRSIKKRNALNATIPKEGVSFRPIGIPLFFFIIGFIFAGIGLLLIILGIIDIRAIGILFLGLPFALFGGLLLAWAVSFLGDKITISKDNLSIQRVALLSGESAHLWNIGKHHLELKWAEIKDFHVDNSYLIIETIYNKRYSYPIGWCSPKALVFISRQKTEWDENNTQS